MTREQIYKLAESSDPYVKDIYSFIKDNTSFSAVAGDSGEEELIQLPSNAVDALSQKNAAHVTARYIEHYGNVTTPDDARKTMFMKMAGDGIFNPKNKIGTLLDPTVYTQSDIPIMLGPYEGSAIYANGGLPATIIDKKSRSMMAQGATFKSLDDNFWDADKIKQLEDAAIGTGFNDVCSDAACGAFIYGGSILYPVFKKDTPSSYTRDLDKLHLEKDCIDRWVYVDRWNVVMVPSYIVTAKDYLKPKSLYIAQSALDINTSRIAMIKPKPVPYWVALYNLGWSPSDFSGWLRSYYGYEITCQSIPVMAQQMSLLLYKMPLDGLNATIGVNNVEKLMEINEQKMAEWSALSPKAVNMIGEVEVVDRTYSGFDQFIGAMKSNLASQAELPEPVLWHTPNKGFSDNTTESLLKQSEMLQMKQGFLERSMTPCTEALIAHVFGMDSEEWKRRDLIRMSFNKPVISTEKDLAETGARFAASVSSFTQAGVSPDIAIELSKQFFPTVKVTQELLSRAKKSYEDAQKNQSQLGQKMGNTKGKANTTGSFTKAE